MGRRSPTLRLPPPAMTWMIVVQALAVAPHAGRIPLWSTALAIVIGLWRYGASTRHWRAPGVLTRLMLVVLCAALVFSSYGTLLGRQAGTTLLVLMFSLKLLELNSQRDVMVFLFLGYFLLATTFLFSQSIPLALYVFLATVVLTGALMVAHRPASASDIGGTLRRTSLLVAQAVPVMLVLFVLFPRITGPLWNLPEDAFSATTGLSDTMSPGSITRLSRSHAVALRAEFEDNVPAANQLYWRALVMTRFDGRTWSVDPDDAGPAIPVRPDGPAVQQRITLEPHNEHWLIGLDRPASAPPGDQIRAGYQLWSRAPVRQRQRYTLVSYPKHRPVRALSLRQRRAALQLPRGANPETRNLGRKLRRNHRGDREVVEAALTLFREQPFHYTLSPPPLGRNPVDQFLFETRAGFCEHYASAFVVLMREAGIPARVVGGYQGGELNPVGDYVIVRQSDAHAWAEVWLGKQGWVRVDPTAAVSPDRVESGIEGALPEVAAGTLTRSANPMLHKLVLYWDALNNGWNQWILGYGPKRQLEFLAGLGLGELSWLQMAGTLAGLVALLLAGTFVVMILRRRRPARDPVPLIYERFCEKLERQGLARQPQEGPLAFADRVARHRPDLAGRVRRITQLYVALRYGRGPSDEQMGKFRSQVARFSARYRPTG